MYSDYKLFVKLYSVTLSKLAMPTPIFGSDTAYQSLHKMVIQISPFTLTFGCQIFVLNLTCTSEVIDLTNVVMNNVHYLWGLKWKFAWYFDAEFVTGTYKKYKII